MLRFEIRCLAECCHHNYAEKAASPVVRTEAVVTVVPGPVVAPAPLWPSTFRAPATVFASVESYTYLLPSHEITLTDPMPRILVSLREEGLLRPPCK